MKFALLALLAAAAMAQDGSGEDTVDRTGATSGKKGKSSSAAVSAGVDRIDGSGSGDRVDATLSGGKTKKVGDTLPSKYTVLSRLTVGLVGQGKKGSAKSKKGKKLSGVGLGKLCTKKFFLTRSKVQGYSTLTPPTLFNPGAYQNSVTAVAVVGVAGIVVGVAALAVRKQRLRSGFETFDASTVS